MSPPDGNLLLVANYPPGTGYAWWLMQRYWLELAALAAERGVTTYLAYPKAGPVPEAVADSPIEILWHRVSTRSAGKVWTSARLFRQLRIRNLYFTDRAYFDPGYLAFRAAGVRRIINHDHTPGDRPKIDGLRGSLKRFRNRLPGVHVDRWISLSPLMKTRAVDNGCIPPERISVVPNGIDPIERSPGAAGAVRSMFELPSDVHVVVTVGRAHPIKRIDFALRVARYLADTRPDLNVTFLYIGAGPEFESLQAMAADLHLDSRRFVFAGHRTDVRAILPGCDLALHPSRGEGFSLAILEYLSAGLPTLVPDIPSVSQIIEPGRTGDVYPDGDVAAAGRWIARLIDDRHLRKQMGEAAATLVAHEYSLTYACTQLRSRVDEVLWIGAWRP